MSGLFLGGSVSLPAPITVNTNWATDSVVHPTSKTSTVTGTLTVPASNTGGIDITFTNTAGGTAQYIFNAGSATTLVSGTNFAAATSDTWQFRLLTPSSAGTFAVTVTDHINNVTVGTWTLTVT